MNLTYPQADPCANEDLEAIFAFERRLFEEEPILDAPFWQRDCIDVHWVLDEDGVRVGYLAVELNAEPGETSESPSRVMPGSIFSIVLGIEPERQGQGIGTTARLWTVREAPFLGGMSRILSTVRPSNTRSIALNERVGFVRKEDVIPGFYADNGDDALVFEYRLA